MIRLSKETDLKYLGDVERSAVRKFDEYLGREPSTSQEDNVLPYNLLQKGHDERTLWVVENNEVPVGFLAAEAIDNKQLHIHEISVCQNHQGNGYGRQLIEKAKSYVTDHSLNTVTLTTEKEIPWNYPYYKKQGFTEVNIEDCSPVLARILQHDKEHSPSADNRIAMVYRIT